VKLWYTRVSKSKCKKKTKFKELFVGLKKSKFALAYNLLILSRRMYLALWIICLSLIPLDKHLVGATFLQLVHASLIVLIRPFKKVKDNIIEILNEVTFTILMALLIRFNKKAIWSRTSISVYIYVMIFPAVFFIFISICKYSAS
jgi:hypothetical protein